MRREITRGNEASQHEENRSGWLDYGAGLPESRWGPESCQLGESRVECGWLQRCTSRRLVDWLVCVWRGQHTMYCLKQSGSKCRIYI